VRANLLNLVILPSAIQEGVVSCETLVSAALEPAYFLM
jgi:hypothetical protein